MVCLLVIAPITKISKIVTKMHAKPSNKRFDSYVEKPKYLKKIRRALRHAFAPFVVKRDSYRSKLFYSSWRGSTTFQCFSSSVFM